VVWPEEGGVVVGLLSNPHQLVPPVLLTVHDWSAVAVVGGWPAGTWGSSIPSPRWSHVLGCTSWPHISDVAWGDCVGGCSSTLGILILLQDDREQIIHSEMLPPPGRPVWDHHSRQCRGSPGWTSYRTMTMGEQMWA
jgi:hypothetical protein